MPSWAVNVHVVAHSGRQASLELQNGSFGRLLCLVNGWMAFTRVRLPGRISDCLGSDRSALFGYKGLQNLQFSQRGNCLPNSDVIG